MRRMKEREAKKLEGLNNDAGRKKMVTGFTLCLCVSVVYKRFLFSMLK